MARFPAQRLADRSRSVASFFIYRPFYAESIEQARLMLVEAEHHLAGPFPRRPKSPHQIQQPPVLAMNLEQGKTASTSSADSSFTVVRIVFGMAAAPALPAECPDFEHAITVYHFPKSSTRSVKRGPVQAPGNGRRAAIRCRWPANRELRAARVADISPVKTVTRPAPRPTGSGKL